MGLGILSFGCHDECCMEMRVSPCMVLNVSKHESGMVEMVWQRTCMVSRGFELSCGSDFVLAFAFFSSMSLSYVSLHVESVLFVAWFCLGLAL